MSKLKRVEVMSRASFVRYGDKMILRFDLSNLDMVEDVRRVVDYFRSVVERMPKKSMVGLVDFDGLKVANEVTQEVISLTEFCNPYFRATAVIANDTAAITLAESVIHHFGKINIPVYREDEAAQKWLLSQ